MSNPLLPDQPTPVEFKVESPQNIYLDLGRAVFHKKKATLESLLIKTKIISIK